MFAMIPSRFAQTTLGAAIVVAAALALPAQAQNVAIVNGKPVPMARVNALIEQATSQGQPRTPELEAQARDEVVLREMFVQQAEKEGLAATPEYKTQMELARQSILIRELFAAFQKQHPVTDADIQAEYPSRPHSSRVDRQKSPPRRNRG